mmetsp:Transcript_88958/g.171167  ORF Transcript_88958/g.171167 Transcript_88958/m.171167 type:complete len:114 (+) Transcript_88958:1021-1362(+)
MQLALCRRWKPILFLGSSGPATPTSGVAGLVIQSSMMQAVPAVAPGKRVALRQQQQEQEQAAAMTAAQVAFTSAAVGALRSVSTNKSVGRPTGLWCKCRRRLDFAMVSALKHY